MDVGTGLAAPETEILFRVVHRAKIDLETDVLKQPHAVVRHIMRSEDGKGQHYLIARDVIQVGLYCTAVHSRLQLVIVASNKFVAENFNYSLGSFGLPCTPAAMPQAAVAFALCGCGHFLTWHASG